MWEILQAVTGLQTFRIFLASANHLSGLREERNYGLKGFALVDVDGVI